MDHINSPQFSRNYGFWTETEQQAILNAKVAIAGVGGDGFQLGIKLAMMGVQTFDIADPEIFEPENSNRVFGATTMTYGQKKAEIFRKTVHAINPNADIRIFEQGVNAKNVDKFLDRATVVFDESELTHLEIGTALARAARSKGIPNILVMNIGFAAQVTAFKPDGNYTFEKFMGIPEGMSLEQVKKLKLKFSRCLPYIPPYADLATLNEIRNGAPLPSIAQGVDIASALGASQAFLHLVEGAGNHRPQPIWAPKVAFMDAYTLKSHITWHPRTSHYKYMTLAVVRKLIGRFPKADYSVELREKRNNSSKNKNY